MIPGAYVVPGASALTRPGFARVRLEGSPTSARVEALNPATGVWVPVFDRLPAETALMVAECIHQRSPR